MFAYIYFYNIYIHIYIYIYIFIHIYIYMYIYIYTCIYVFTYMIFCLYVYLFTYLYVYVYLDLYMDIHVYIHTYIYICIYHHTGKFVLFQFFGSGINSIFYRYFRIVIYVLSHSWCVRTQLTEAFSIKPRVPTHFSNFSSSIDKSHMFYLGKFFGGISPPL